LYAVSIYFLLCLRLHSFREWSWDADVREVYGIVAWYNHTYGVTDIATNWMYGPSLNYYRLASGKETIDELHAPIPTPRGHSLYVLNAVFEDELIRQEGLRVVYRGPTTDVVVAVRPDAEARWRAASACHCR